MKLDGKARVMSVRRGPLYKGFMSSYYKLTLLLLENRFQLRSKFCTGHGPLTTGQIRKIAGCACTGNARKPPQTSKEPLVSNPGMHHGTCVANRRWRGKRSRHSRSMHNPQFHVSSKRPMTAELSWLAHICYLIGLLESALKKRSFSQDFIDELINPLCDGSLGPDSI